VRLRRRPGELIFTSYLTPKLISCKLKIAAVLHTMRRAVSPIKEINCCLAICKTTSFRKYSPCPPWSVKYYGYS
jgi:hypothetical protein